MESRGTRWHLDLWPAKKGAPTIVFCHGLSTCGRMMANFVKPFHDKGYNIVCPDLPGFGLSLQNGRRGCCTIEEMVECLKECVLHAQKLYQGKVFLTGISLGGALSYYAAAAGAQVAAIASLNLMDLGDARTREISDHSGLLTHAIPALRVLAKLMPELPLPLKRFINVEKLCDDAALVERFKKNPLVVKTYTLRAALSLLTSHPEIPFKEFESVPILVLHGKKDKLIPESVTRDSFDRILGQKKYVLLEEGEHIPLKASAMKKYVEEVDGWFGRWFDR